jgi:IS30 family transposase
MIKYARLTLQLREVIENMHADGYVQEAIAAAVGVDQSTVSRELRRRPGAYAARPCHAQAQSRSRIPTTVPLLDRNGELRRHLVNRMRSKYSIAQSLRLIGAKHPHLPTISPQVRLRLALRRRHPRQEIHPKPHDQAPDPAAAEGENRLRQGKNQGHDHDRQAPRGSRRPNRARPLGRRPRAPRGAAIPSGGERPPPSCCRSSMTKLGAA